MPMRGPRSREATSCSGRRVTPPARPGRSTTSATWRERPAIRPDARAHYQRGADLFRSIGDVLGVARSAIDLGHLACEERDLAAAHALFGEALDMFERLDQRLGVAIALEAFACAALVEGDRDRALTLAGAAAAVRRAGGAFAPGRPDQGTRVERRVAELWALDDPDAARAPRRRRVAADSSGPSPWPDRPPRGAAGY